ncbi:hypothetical protein HPB47_002335 [Ixodes persulcatus]|uniref:Uncharacterized protein n=1 Tax=Ixodes persulcatus TaxID=34615 RepID=A0AC60PLI5_IXOPE|nr:hypothetical protein HPB47_002335 [Ixodes persulcatus]
MYSVSPYDGEQRTLRAIPMPYDGRVKPRPRAEKLAANPIQPPAEYKCLLRAHGGPKKISTVINAKDVNRFQLAYANLLKGNIDGLKKKDKKKSTAKATQ